MVDHTIRPKSVARDLYERAMTFTDYVGFYGLARSEGLVLRYLTDAYKGLVQNVPEDAKTDDLLDLTEWLGELVRQVDSSLLDEWGDAAPPRRRGGRTAPRRRSGRPWPRRARRGGVTANPWRVPADGAQRAVPLGRAAGPRAYADLAERLPGTSWSAESLAAAMALYRERHERSASGAGAHGAELFQVVESADGWTVRQALDDPSGDRDWAITARVDLEASDEEGRAVVVLDAIGAG